MKLATFSHYTEPAELERTNPWDSTHIAVGLGDWTGGAIDGTEEAVLYADDGYKHSVAVHLNRSEVADLIDHLQGTLDAMKADAS